MNLSYGIMTWAFGLQTKILMEKLGPANPEAMLQAERDELGHQVFAEAASWWWMKPWYPFTTARLHKAHHLT